MRLGTRLAIVARSGMLRIIWRAAHPPQRHNYGDAKQKEHGQANKYFHVSV